MSEWGYRVCSACGYDLNADYYSNNQWHKGVGYSRCRTCVQEGISRDDDGFETARANRSSSRCALNSEVDFYGSFREVHLGKYTTGSRTGQSCVGKYFKPEYIRFEEEFFKKDLYAVEKALKIITQFNQTDVIQHMIRLNVPEAWTCGYTGGKLLLEPYIENYTKFNSNTGWAKQSNYWGKAMQALSHYSYHISSGQFLLCDLQGGVNHLGAVLTDPVILSHNGRFGVTDLGREGIINFFHHHRCNKFCDSRWTKPRNTQSYFYRDAGTTMILQDSDDGNDDYDEDDDDNNNIGYAFCGLAF